MEEEVHVIKYVSTLLDHSIAAVKVAIYFQDTTAMVMICNHSELVQNKQCNVLVVQF